MGDKKHKNSFERSRFPLGFKKRSAQILFVALKKAVQTLLLVLAFT